MELTAVAPRGAALEPAVRSFVDFLAANIVAALAGAPESPEGKPRPARRWADVHLPLREIRSSWHELLAMPAEQGYVDIDTLPILATIR